MVYYQCTINVGFERNKSSMSYSKVDILSRITSRVYWSSNEEDVNDLVVSQFSTWLTCLDFFSNTRNKINHLHERCLFLTYNNKKYSFEKLLKKDKSISVHNRSLQVFAALHWIQTFKVDNLIVRLRWNFK